MKLIYGKFPSSNIIRKIKVFFKSYTNGIILENSLILEDPFTNTSNSYIKYNLIPYLKNVSNNIVLTSLYECLCNDFNRLPASIRCNTKYPEYDIVGIIQLLGLTFYEEDICYTNGYQLCFLTIGYSNNIYTYCLVIDAVPNTVKHTEYKLINIFQF